MVEHVVVDEARAVDQLDGDGRAHEAVGVAGGLARRDEDEQRTQPLAAGRDRRARVLRERRPMTGRKLGEALLDLLHPRGELRTAGLHESVDAPGARHRRRVPQAAVTRRPRPRGWR